MDGFALAVLRTTGCTIGAAIAVDRLLAKQQSQSPAIHRLAWFLVLLQGWAHFSIALAIPALPIAPRTIDAKNPSVERGLLPTRAADNSELVIPVAVPLKTTFGISNWIVLVWFVGVAAVVAYYVRQYKSLVFNVPFGRSPTDPRWQEEWKRISADVGVGSRTRFRLTDDVGPLCCFVPFVYLVMAPERLWRSFQPKQREFVLRHELAHIVRRDLWKSVAVRILVLPQWFNPFAWKAVRGFDKAAEWACDDLVVRSCESSRSEYPATLLEIAESCFHPLGGTMGVRGGVLTERVNRLVQPKLMEETKMMRLLFPTMLVLLFVAQSVRLVAAPADEQQIDNLRAAELERTGLVPYLVEPPDILLFEPTTPDATPDATPLVPRGEYIVGPDGKINLGKLGKVYVTGKTLQEIMEIVNAKLSQSDRSERIIANVRASNSKCYYVVVEGHESGDTVLRVPVTGKETVLDAIAQIGGFDQMSNEHLWISRPGRNGTRDEILPIELDAIARGAKTETNYQLLPGDRVYVSCRRPREAEVSVARKDPGGAPSVVPPTPVTDPSEIAQLGGLQQASFIGPDGTFIARLPTVVFADSAREDAKVRIQINVLSDVDGNLSEYWTGKNGDALLVDSDQIAASIRILRKNQLVKTVMSPAIICAGGQEATLHQDRFQITAKPRITDRGGVFLTAKTNCGPYARDVTANAVLQRGEALLVRASRDDGVYVILTAELQR